MVKDGGPAFPTAFETGMTLRDYFAAKAMQANLQVSGDDPWARIALDAYRVANAMLAEREKGGEK